MPDFSFTQLQNNKTNNTSEPIVFSCLSAVEQRGHLRNARPLIACSFALRDAHGHVHNVRVGFDVALLEIRLHALPWPHNGHGAPRVLILAPEPVQRLLLPRDREAVLAGRTAAQGAQQCQTTLIPTQEQHASVKHEGIAGPIVRALGHAVAIAIRRKREAAVGW